MWSEIYENIRYYLLLNLQPEVFWNVLPLVLATLFIISYFAKHKDERAGWNTYFSNSLIFIFVSINLFRHIYNLGVPNAGNFFAYSAKSIAVLLLLSIGALYMKINFNHLLPERYARIVSSPLSINSVAYAIMLYVYSSGERGIPGIISLFAIALILISFFEIIRIPMKKLFILVEEEQVKERFRNIKEAKLQIDELKRELKERMRELEVIKLKQLEKEKKIAIKLKKELKK